MPASCRALRLASARTLSAAPDDAAAIAAAALERWTPSQCACGAVTVLRHLAQLHWSVCHGGAGPGAASRQYPWIRFDYDEKDKLHRLACQVENISFAYAGMDKPLIKGFSIAIEAGEKVAIIGENGVGKTTLLKLLLGA